MRQWDRHGRASADIEDSGERRVSEHSGHLFLAIQCLLTHIVLADDGLGAGLRRRQKHVVVAEQSANLSGNDIALEHRVQQLGRAQLLSESVKGERGRLQGRFVYGTISSSGDGVDPGGCVAGPESRIQFCEDFPAQAYIRDNGSDVVARVLRCLTDSVQAAAYRRCCRLAVEGMALYGDAKRPRLAIQQRPVGLRR